jgi:hypothetical protein
MDAFRKLGTYDNFDFMYYILLIKGDKMGETISFSCKNREDQDYLKPSMKHKLWNIEIGIGMLYSPEMVFVKGFDGPPLIDTLLRSKKMRQDVHDLLNQGYTSDDKYEHSVYFCSRCMTFYGRFYFKLIKGSDFYEPPHRCSSCRHPIIPVSIIEEGGILRIVDNTGCELEWQCPECDSYELKIGNFISMWD